MTKVVYRRKGPFGLMVPDGEGVIIAGAWQEAVGMAAGTGC